MNEGREQEMALEAAKMTQKAFLEVPADKQHEVASKVFSAEQMSLFAHHQAQESASHDTLMSNQSLEGQDAGKDAANALEYLRSNPQAWVESETALKEAVAGLKAA